MNLLLARILFLVGSMTVGYKIAGPVGLVIGGLAALIMIFLEIGLRKVSVSGLSTQ